MTMERERISKETLLPPWTRLEHEARYAFAARFVTDRIVVDCACGAGIGSATFADAQAKHVFAFDLDKQSVAKAAAEYDAVNLSFACASACSLPLPARQVDVFISLETIEHLADDAGFLSEVTRSLKPDGVFICSTPNRTITNPRATLQDKPWNPFHVREYTVEEFYALLAGHFRSVTLYAQNPVSPPLVKLASLLSDCFGRMAAIRFSQILKLPRLVIRRPAQHRVVPYREGSHYEYITGVCRNPLRHSILANDSARSVGGPQ